jgi:hypothetical protein
MATFDIRDYIPTLCFNEPSTKDHKYKQILYYNDRTLAEYVSLILCFVLKSLLHLQTTRQRNSMKKRSTIH